MSTGITAQGGTERLNRTLELYHSESVRRSISFLGSGTKIVKIIARNLVTMETEE